MNRPEIDIIVPVWNKPVETGRCLASLLKHSPEARFILMDNASERETESLLQEFAEALGERALLLRNDRNQEFVTVVNRGLARAEAPVVLVVRNTTTVVKGWLSPTLDFLELHPQAGLLVPNLEVKNSKTQTESGRYKTPAIEITHASFDLVLLRKSLYDRIGPFDEEMDGGLWCLKDYSRRAWREGFTSVSVAGPPVFCEENAQMGSVARREEKVVRSRQLYLSRWGAERSFCLDLSGRPDRETMRRQFDDLLAYARCGHRFTVLAQRKTWREILRGGYHSLHRNITVKRLPFLFAAGTAKRIFSALRGKDPDIIMVSSPEQLADLLGRGAG